MAVKTLSSRDPEMVAKFMEEAELMKKFSHPNIVSLLGTLCIAYIYILYISNGCILVCVVFEIDLYYIIFIIMDFSIIWRI